MVFFLVFTDVGRVSQGLGGLNRVIWGFDMFCVGFSVWGSRI